MKKLSVVIVLFMAIYLCSCVTPHILRPNEIRTDLAARDVYVSDTVKTHKTADELYNASMKWLCRVFKDPEYVISYSNEKTHTVVCKAFFYVNYALTTTLGLPATETWFNLTFVAEDNEVIITFSDFYLVVEKSSELPLEQKAFLQKMEPIIKPLLSDFESFILEE